MRKVTVILLCLMLMPYVGFANTYVEVFSAQSICQVTVEGQSIKYYEIKSPSSANHLLDQCVQGVTKDNLDLKKVKACFDEQKPRLAKAYEGLMQLQTYGIKQLPAIVFNHGEAVIYGTENVRDAIGRFLAWQSHAHLELVH